MERVTPTRHWTSGPRTGASPSSHWPWGRMGGTWWAGPTTAAFTSTTATPSAGWRGSPPTRMTSTPSHWPTPRASSSSRAGTTPWAGPGTGAASPRGRRSAWPATATG